MVNSELPLCCTPPATACEVSTGTSAPTLSVAAILSVAMMLELSFNRADLAGSVEAAVMAGLQAARAIVGSREPIVAGGPGSQAPPPR